MPDFTLDPATSAPAGTVTRILPTLGRVRTARHVLDALR